MKKSPSETVHPGERVRVRRQRWTVVAAESHAHCQIVTLSGVGATNAGTERRIVTPFEPVESLEWRPRPVRAGLGRWRRALCDALLRPQCTDQLQAAGAAGIDLLPYQLEPALALRRGLASRLLLADEVGLGKTIQAGLALAELRASGAVKRAIVLSPAGLRDQWADELASRFALHAPVVDARDIRQRAADLPVGVNPWSTIPLAIASLDYVKRPEVLPAVAASPWDAVVVDEAHALSLASERREAAEALCRTAGYVILLTATPHSGDHRAFASLCRVGAVSDEVLLAFRRTRQEVSPGRKRRIHRLMVKPCEAERRMHGLLARLSRESRRERGDHDREGALTMMVLQKRACSSAGSLYQSVQRRLALLQATTPQAMAQLALPLEDTTGEGDAADEPPAMMAPLVADPGRERRWLEELAESARRAMQEETKLAALRRYVTRLMRRGETAIVFTEYRDTLLRVQQALPCGSALLHGGLSRPERREALAAFEQGAHGVLLATDAAGEGLNLQRRCRLVIDLELPWNPTRLEQRIGRVDRIGQTRTVHAVHLVAAGTGEMRILDRLRVRAARARADVGAPDALGIEPREVPGCDTISAGDRPALEFVRLQSEAAIEHARLVRCRALKAKPRDARRRARDESIPVARARRPAMRALLARQLLVLLQTDCEDGCGRIVGSHLSPVVVNTGRAAGPGSRFSRVSDLAHIFQALERLNLDTIDPSLPQWRARAMAACLQFWRTRLARERAMLRQLDEGPASLFQPGLFDRRSDRAHAGLAAHEQSIRDEIERRLAHFEIVAACRLVDPRPVAVLTSGRW